MILWMYPDALGIFEWLESCASELTGLPSSTYRETLQSCTRAHADLSGLAVSRL
ncbi:hypothetical protein BJ508DRAFT_410023 [Ascobolus immersus RN42]|uniref:Uncharacterized protein n=1 Tax=Ascobolus immersus RN42 TaxID=1160509 RepID=A0A3N4IPM9_ASCIM|nr:hypothetical protein BJ508DRAFT_410023 [Ascobolus immersus RN42]